MADVYDDLDEAIDEAVDTNPLALRDALWAVVNECAESDRRGEMVSPQTVRDMIAEKVRRG